MQLLKPWRAIYLSAQLAVAVPFCPSPVSSIVSLELASQSQSRNHLLYGLSPTSLSATRGTLSSLAFHLSWSPSSHLIFRLFCFPFDSAESGAD